MRALISVYYKEGVEELAKALQELGYEIVSSSSTAKYLRERGIRVKEIEQITNFPEVFGGRVKTLHPFIHGGILMRDWVEEDKRQAQELGIEPIDVVVVNLYPFEEKLREGLEERELMEFVDIGGPALIRASAKNFYRVLVVCDPADYRWVAQKLREKSLTLEDRKYLAVKAFSLTAYYDALISNALANLFGISEMFSQMAIPLKLAKGLRYGENPIKGAGSLAILWKALGLPTRRSCKERICPLTTTWTRTPP
jgi:phosphoribosylaminoimidazolecarboxamide formyltransferase/IMP cyclohydrolase